MEPIRLQKYLAEAGIASRRKCEEYIVQGKVKVNGKNKVEFEGRLWSLSAFTGTYLPIEKQNNSGAYQGPKYFTYNNKTLWDLRLELEKQGEN